MLYVCVQVDGKADVVVDVAATHMAMMMETSVADKEHEEGEQISEIKYEQHER